MTGQQNNNTDPLRSRDPHRPGLDDFCFLCNERLLEFEDSEAVGAVNTDGVWICGDCIWEGKG